jgi:acyl-CoA synthetase (AMP-forming)/AMP-acid ligase II
MSITTREAARVYSTGAHRVASRPHYSAGDAVTSPDAFHDGWLRTGDMGRISPDGFLTLTDRSKDVIKRSRGLA